VHNGRAAWIRSGLTILLAMGGLAGGLLGGQTEIPSSAQSTEEVVLFRQGEDGYAGCADTRISEENPTKNFGDRWHLVLGMRGRAAILIRFDVSSVPSDAWVQEATLGLYADNYGPQSEEPLVAAAYPVIRAWEEMEATWHKATDADDWGEAGCNDTSSDRSPVAAGSTPVDDRFAWYEWDVTSAVQQWVHDPAGNQGLVVKQTNTEVGGEYNIRGSEFADVQWRPYLEIKYSLATPTPTQTLTPTLPPTPEPPPCVGTPEPGAIVTILQEEPPPCVGTPEPGAIVTILQEGAGYSGAEDTYLSFDDRETTYDTEWFMRIGYRQHFSGLIKYDVSTIPEGSRIICAALSLYAERWSGGALRVGAYCVQRENSIEDTTWTWATSDMPWQIGGCNGPDDRLLAPESAVLSRGINRWRHFDLTRVVDGWVNGNDTVWFTASDDGTIANRPRLIVLFVPPEWWEPTPTLTATQTATPTQTATITPTPTNTATPTVTPTQAEPRTDTFQNGLEAYVGCVDARISEEAASTNFGQMDLKVGARQRISFDLSSIPSNATIQSAWLSVYAFHREGTAGFDVDVYAVNREWAENAVSWNRATSSDSWGTPGCNNIVSDRADFASDTASSEATGWHTWSVGDDVQRMVSNPGASVGWLLRQSAEVSGVLSMYSGEHGQPDYSPKLVVTYTAP